MSGTRPPSLRRFYRGLLSGSPWRLTLALGIASAAVGVAITFKPYSSLGILIALVAVAFALTGIGELASATATRERWAGGGWIAAAIAVAVWPGLTIRGLALFVGLVLLVGGALRIASALRGTADERLIAALSGLTRGIFGILALSWPDITVLVLGLFVGPAMILFGIGQVAGALRRRDHGARHWPMWLRAAGMSVSLVVALGLLGVSRAVHNASSSPTAFYTPPSNVPSRPGVLLRSEPYTTGVPGDARAWRILYTTTRGPGEPAVASGVVLVSRMPPTGPRPVIAWAHGTTGFASKCAPSLLASGLASGVLPAEDQIVANGWVLVATDYVGLGTKGPHPYLIGDPEGRSVLDAVRAARQLKQVDLAGKTVVWGHSQGGGAALWTGIDAPSYAPDDHVVGVAALAPATDLPALFSNIRSEPVGKIMGPYVLAAYSAVYPDVHFDDYVRPAAQAVAHANANRCLSGPEALVSVATSLGSEDVFSKSPDAGALGKRLAENIPTGHIAAPLLIAQGLSDALVLPSVQKRYVDARCAAGQSLEYRTYKGFDHVGVVADPSSPLIPDLIAWTKARFAGTPQPSGCRFASG